MQRRRGVQSLDGKRSPGEKGNGNHIILLIWTEELGYTPIRVTRSQTGLLTATQEQPQGEEPLWG